MSKKEIIKVTIEDCTKKARSREGNVYPINFVFSNTEKPLLPGQEKRGRLMASGEIEIL